MQRNPCIPRPRIEHSQVLDAPDFARYKQLGVIASMQPNHLLTDMAWAQQRLGHDRARYSYAWKSFLDHGVPLAFGTDYPVEPITPFRGIYAAVTRENEAGTQSYFPEEKLTIAQALYAYTQGSAYAEFSETYKGMLAARHGRGLRRARSRSHPQFRRTTFSARRCCARSSPDIRRTSPTWSRDKTRSTSSRSTRAVPPCC